MRKLFAFCAAVFSAFPVVAAGADFNVGGTTIVRFEERSFTGQSSQDIIPATQFLGADAAGLGDGNLSLHLYGWGRQDLAEISAPGGRNEGQLSYGYLRYRFSESNGIVKAGRFFVNSGVSNEHVDGLLLGGDLAYGLTAEFFGGAPVRFNNDNRGDYVAGGRVAYRRPGWLEIGASAVEEKGAVSQRNFQAGPPRAFSVTDRRGLIGADIWLAVGGIAEVTGRSAYNTAVSSLAEHNYLLLVHPIKKLSITGAYVERRYKGFFAGSNLPQLFRPERNEDGVQYGGGVTFAVAEAVEVNADYRRIRRDSIGNTDRFGIGTRFTFKPIYAKAGLEYHRTSAPDVITPFTAVSSYSLSYHEMRGWLMYDRSKYLLSVDVIGHLYDDDKNPSFNGRSDDLEAVVSAGYRVVENVTFSADLSYGYNPQLKEEFRALARAEFGFGFFNKGGK